VLEVLSATHNHEPSKDMSRHPFYCRFTRDETVHIEGMIKSIIPTQQILSSLRLRNQNIQVISKTVNNLKAKVQENICLDE
jgi:hypothetical protein